MFGIFCAAFLFAKTNKTLKIKTLPFSFIAIIVVSWFFYRPVSRQTSVLYAYICLVSHENR